MRIDTMTWEHLPRFAGRHVGIYGTDANALALVRHIREAHPDVTVDFFLDDCSPAERAEGLPVHNAARARELGLLRGAVLIVASMSPMGDVNRFLDDDLAEIYVCSRQLHAVFGERDGAVPCRSRVMAKKHVLPFYLERGTPPIAAVLTNAFAVDPPMGKDVLEIADFGRQEYTVWEVPSPPSPLSLRALGDAVPQSALPMRMSHLGYLAWTRGIHVAQLSPSRRWLVGVRYNFHFLDILDTETGELTRWHDLPPEDGLWIYVATGDFDGDKDAFLFVRWPLADAIAGMRDGSNRVRCQVGRLDLGTLTAEILHEFEFQDRIHQCTISGDGRYMVFAPMRVLRPGGDPATLRQEDIMRNLQETVVLDKMATLDLSSGKVWFTEIPYPIPAHFELDPFDPTLFYVSTHSLMPHAEGVLCFQPGTLHKMRIVDGETLIEGTYTHPGFIRTTQHCVFAWRGKTYIAATNQNKLEIIDAETMRLWHCHKIADDPFYDNADFNDPEFLKKPFNLPSQPAWCDSVSASGDGEYLILYLAGRFAIFSMATKNIVGHVLTRGEGLRSSHGRYWMQNAPERMVRSMYGTLRKKD